MARSLLSFGSAAIWCGFFSFGLLLTILSGCQTKDDSKNGEAEKSGLLKSEKDFRDKLAELRLQREKVKRAVKRLEQRKAENLRYLREEKGIKSSADLTDDDDVKIALRNLQGWSKEIENLNSEIEYYDEATRRISAMLDEIERKRINDAVGLSEGEYLELRKIVLDLNERLNTDSNDILEDDELSKLLDEELEKDATADDNGK